MSPSAGIAKFIQGYETCAKAMKNRPGFFQAYMPTPNDVPTAGWGSTGADIHMGTVWSQAECDARFVRDLAQFGAKVSGLLGSSSTTQAQYDAMVSLAYNIGVGNFMQSSVLTNHKAGHYGTAALAFGLWNKQKQLDGSLKVLNGLTTRRAAEAAWYRGRV